MESMKWPLLLETEAWPAHSTRVQDSHSYRQPNPFPRNRDEMKTENQRTIDANVLIADLGGTEPLSPTDQEVLDDAARNATAARVPFSGGAERALVYTRGAEIAGRALSRVWAAVRR
jgi:hypothetical protein